MQSSSDFSGSKDQPSMKLLYRKALEALNDAEIPYLVGGAHGLNYYTGIWRDTKDLDIFVLPDDHDRGLQALEKSGFRTVLTHPHWLGKAINGEYFIDIIFSSGNAIGRVDNIWFTYAAEGNIMGVPAKICPAEEMIWSKAFIMERERYDGADIMHFLLACAEGLDWKRLLWRFDNYWRVIYSYLILFGFVYPSERTKVPVWVMNELSARLEKETDEKPPGESICQGTLLSKTQFKIDVEERGFKDARRIPFGKMTREEITHWDNFDT